MTATPHEDGTPRDSEKAVKEAVGIDTPIEILSTSLWYLTHRVATDYQSGNIFFVGDSAHTLSPSGGFGMNTGVSDALDLGWKLAAVLRGWASSQLLETYQIIKKSHWRLPNIYMHSQERNYNSLMNYLLKKNG